MRYQSFAIIVKVAKMEFEMVVGVSSDGVSMERWVRLHAMFVVEGVRYREVYGRPPRALYRVGQKG